jgi:hypothetical protein
MAWIDRPIRAGAIWGAVLAALPAIPIAFIFIIFATAEDRDPGVWSVIATIAIGILIGGIIILCGAMLGAMIGGVVSRLARKRASR